MASVMTFVAIVVAFYIAYKEAKRKDLNVDMFFMSALWMGAGALIGGWLAFFLTPGPGFLNIYHPGAHSVGVIVGGGLGIAAYCLYKKENIKKKCGNLTIFFTNLAEIWGLGAMIGTFFYRIGDFLSHCIEIGTPTNLPWAVIDNGIARHPINLYYSLAGIVIFVILIEINKIKISKEVKGYTLTWFLMIYPLSRLFVDLYRVQYSKFFGLSVDQLIFLLLTIQSIIAIMAIHILYRFEKRRQFVYPPLDLIRYLLKK